MKKFFGEFKKFITRGNVLDMAVGVIVGGAFTAIVNGLSNFVLKPIVNYLIALVMFWITGEEKGLTDIYTPLGGWKYVDVLDPATGEIIGKEKDLVNTIYIDWGSLINAIINFILIALVLFIIVRTINNLKENSEKVKASRLTREDKVAMKVLGLNPKDEADVTEYRSLQTKRDEEEAAAAAEAARLEREANPTTEDLLKKILAVIESK